MNEKDDVSNQSSMQISLNEKLLEEQGNLNHTLNDEQLDCLNKMDTDKLIQVIKQANKYGNGKYSFNYLVAIYNNDSTYSEVDKNCNRKSKNNTVKTRYHGTFNEHFRNYTEDELERKLLKTQNDKKK